MTTATANVNVSETVTSANGDAVQKSILRRIKKLLDHAEHQNADPNEAAVAAAQAASLMARYRLDRAIVEAEGGCAQREPIAEEVGFALPTSKIQRWVNLVIYAITNASDCKYHWWWDTLYVAGKRTRARLVAKFIGRATDRQAAKMLVEFVVAEIDRLAKKALASGRVEAPRTFGNNFRLGAAETVSRRLREAAEARAKGVVEASTDEFGAERTAPPSEVVSAALVLVRRDRAEVDVYYKDLSKRLGLRNIGESKAAYSREAREAGRKAGEGIHLGERLNANSGQRALVGA